MCIAIPPPMHSDHTGSSARLWGWLSDSPQRLMLFGCGVELFFYLLVLLGIHLEKPASLSGAREYAFPIFILFIIFPTASFGLLQAGYPRWLRGVAPGYVSYAGYFFLFTVGAALLMLEWALGVGTEEIGFLLITAGWFFAMRSVWFIYKWAPNPLRKLERMMNIALVSGFVAMLLSMLGLFLGQFQLIDTALMIAVGLYLLPLSLLVLIRYIRA